MVLSVSNILLDTIYNKVHYTRHMLEVVPIVLLQYHYLSWCIRSFPHHLAALVDFYLIRLFRL